MACLFDGIRKMSDDEIRIQIALFRNITLVNVAKETGGRFISAFADIANSVVEMVSKKTPFEYQVKKVSDMTWSECERLKGKDRTQLEYELKLALIQKCRELNSALDENNENEEVSITDQKLGIYICDEAAKSYGIDRYLSHANKIEQLNEKYNEAFLNALHNRLCKQNAGEIEETDKRLQLKLNEITLDSKRELQKKLLPKEFSGKGIGKILRLEKGTKYLGYAIMYMGVECFDYTLSTVDTVMSSLREFKRSSRVILAQFVWKVRTSYADKFTVSADLLPSYVSADQKKEFDEREKDFRAKLEERYNAQKELEKCEADLELLNEKLETARAKLELETRENDEINMRFMSLQNQKDDYVEGRKPENETKKYYSDVNETKRELDASQSSVNRVRNTLHERSEQVKKAETARNIARLNAETSRSKSEELVNAMVQKLQLKWRAYYYKFEFDNNIFENIVVAFNNNEIIQLEEQLKEMHEGKDIKAFAHEVVTEDETRYKTICCVADKKYASITYDDKKVYSIDRK